MTEQRLPFETATAESRPRQRKPSLTDKLEKYLLAHVGEFVSVTQMAAIVGTSGVRQRRLECEQRGVWLKKDGDRGEFRGLSYGFVVLGRKRAAA